MTRDASAFPVLPFVYNVRGRESQPSQSVTESPLKQVMQFSFKVLIVDISSCASHDTP